MIRRPPRSTRTAHSFPTRRSSDRQPDDGLRRVRPAAAARERLIHPSGKGDPLVGQGTEGIGETCAHLAAAKGGRCSRNRHRASLTRSEEHTSELQSLMRTSYAVFCLKKKNKRTTPQIRPTL